MAEKTEKSEKSTESKEYSPFKIIMVLVLAFVAIHIYRNRASLQAGPEEHVGSQAQQQPQPLPTFEHPAYIRITTEGWDQAIPVPNLGRRVEARIVTRGIWWQVRPDMDDSRASKPLPPIPDGPTHIVYQAPPGGGSQVQQWRVWPTQGAPTEGQAMYWYTNNVTIVSR